LGVFPLFLETSTFYWFFQLDDDSQLMKHKKKYVCGSPFPSILKHGWISEFQVFIVNLHLNHHLPPRGSQGLDEFGIDDTGPNADAIDALRTQFHLEPFLKKKGGPKTVVWLVVEPTHLKHISQNGFIFPKVRGENKKY